MRAVATLSLEEAIADSNALADVAKRASVPLADARRVAAALADLPVVQAIRICTASQRAMPRVPPPSSSPPSSSPPSSRRT